MGKDTRQLRKKLRFIFVRQLTEAVKLFLAQSVRQTAQMSNMQGQQCTTAVM